MTKPVRKMLLAVARQGLSECAAALEIWAENLGSRSGLGLESVDHRFT